jgi:hypothetical protein
MNVISSTQFPSGEKIIINNHSKTMTTYRVEFTGAGHARFDVLPGASFEILGNVGVVINVHIEDSVPEGINPA